MHRQLPLIAFLFGFCECVKVAPLAPIETYKTTGKILDFDVESTGNVKCLCAGENNSMVLNVFGEKTDQKTLFTTDCEVTAASTSSILEKKAGAPFYVSSRFSEGLTLTKGGQKILLHYGQDTMKWDFYEFIGKFSGGKEVEFIVCNMMGCKRTVHLQLIHRVDWQAENGDSVPAILAVHIGEEKVENGRCILVVLVLPEDETLWLSQTLAELLIRECAYWHSLRGVGPTTSVSRVRIAIPRAQVFSVQAVRQILNRLSQGGEP